MAKKRNKSKLKKRIIQGLVLLVLAGGLAWYLMPGAVLVQTDEAHIGSLASTVEAEGRTRARDRYVVWAPVAGTLQRLPIAAGDPVVRDQVIARLLPDALALADPQTAKALNDQMAAAEAAKARAVAERDKATAALDQVRAQLRNTEQLAATGQVDALQRDQAQAAVKLAFKDLEAATSTVQAAIYDIAAAQKALQQLRQGTAIREWVLRAPLSGTVLSVAASGAIATGAPLMEIGNPKDLEVVTETTAAEAGQLKLGQRVVLSPEGGDETLEGRVRRIDPILAAAPESETTPETTSETTPESQAEPQHARVIIEFADPPPKWQHLGDGHEVRARITTGVVDSVVKVPAAAVSPEGAQSVVYVVESGRAKKRIVSVGARTADEVVIQSGVKDYDQVILSPGPQIKDGVRVRTR